MKKCAKCGQPLIKTKCAGYLGYLYDPELCKNCNAVNAVVKKMSSETVLDIEDLRELPNLLVFDPAGNNPEEALWGLKFKKVVDKTEK